MQARKDQNAMRHAQPRQSPTLKQPSGGQLFASSMKHRAANTPEEQQLIGKHFPKNIRFHHLWHAVDLNYYDVSDINPAIWHIFKITANPKYIDLRQKAWIGTCLVPKLNEGVYRGDLPAIVPRLRERAINPDQPAPQSHIPKAYKSTINDFLHGRSHMNDAQKRFDNHDDPQPMQPHMHGLMPPRGNINHHGDTHHDAQGYQPYESMRRDDHVNQQTVHDEGVRPRHPMLPYPNGHPKPFATPDHRPIMGRGRVYDDGYRTGPYYNRDDRLGGPVMREQPPVNRRYGDIQTHHDQYQDLHDDVQDEIGSQQYMQDDEAIDEAMDMNDEDQDDYRSRQTHDRHGQQEQDDDEADMARMKRFQKMNAINRDKLLSDYDQTIKHCKIKGVVPRIVIKNLEEATCQQLIAAINENQIGYNKDKWLKNCRMFTRAGGVAIYKINDTLKLMNLSAPGVAPELAEKEFINRWESTVDYNEPEFEELFHIIRGKGNPVPEPNPVRDIALSFASTLGAQFLSNTVGIKYEDMMKVPFQKERDHQEAYRDADHHSNSNANHLPNNHAYAQATSSTNPSTTPAQDSPTSNHAHTKPKPNKHHSDSHYSPATHTSSSSSGQEHYVKPIMVNQTQASSTSTPPTKASVKFKPKPEKDTHGRTEDGVANSNTDSRHDSRDEQQVVTAKQEHANVSSSSSNVNETLSKDANVVAVTNTIKKNRQLGSFTLPSDIDV